MTVDENGTSVAYAPNRLHNSITVQWDDAIRMLYAVRFYSYVYHSLIYIRITGQIKSIKFKMIKRMAKLTIEQMKIYTVQEAVYSQIHALIFHNITGQQCATSQMCSS